MFKGVPETAKFHAGSNPAPTTKDVGWGSG